MRALLRWIRADLRSHRLHALLIVLATGGTAAALLLAGSLLGAAADPWQREFRAAGSPDVRIDLRPSAAAAGGSDEPSAELLAREPGVVAVSPPQHTAETTLVGRRPDGAPTAGGTDRTTLVLRADTPGAARPLLRSGAWLDPADVHGIVLEQSAADAVWAHPGDRLTVLDSHGAPVELRVLGIADSPDQLPSQAAGYDLGWTLPATLDLVQPDPAARGLTLGLHLAHPSDAAYTAQRVVSVLGPERVSRITTWLDARAARQQDNRLAGLLLGLSGLAALLAAALAVAGTAGARIKARTGDIALLKAIGFTAAQVAWMFITEQLLLAVTGVLLGAGGAAIAARAVPAPGGGTDALHQLVPGGTAATGAVMAAALVAIGAAAALPALRAARVAPVPPTDGTRPPAMAARPVRLGLVRRLPPTLVLGLGGVLRRRSGLAGSAVRLTVPVVAATLALSTWSTLDAVTRPDGGVTVPSVTARRTTPAPSGGDAQLTGALAADPAVRGVYPGSEIQALAPGQSATLTLRAVGTTDAPYPFSVVEGRAIRATDEAVAGQGALDLLGARVGQWVRITTGGTPRILHIVGRDLEPEHGGRVLSTGFDTLDRPGDPTGPDFWQLALCPGHDPAEVQRDLPTRAGLTGQVELRLPTGPVTRPGALRASVVGLLLLLALIGLVDLLTMAAAGFHERRRDIGLLRAIGLTPGQSAVVLAVRGTAIALAAVAVGSAVGIPLVRRLIDRQGHLGGIGAGIARAPSAWTFLAMAATCATVAAVLCALPVLRVPPPTRGPDGAGR
ncbi:FtsX-like permease family protein [Kitasatospora paracochleata]|uniref:ABC transport system permease protein n=3 Tax=Kitasatospora paracochleata TaxID=58354 RepID=A0ABT1J1P8_9ACTN|nr:FtsX-like permease family protein [Kitasatospora paracochleata]MCP2311360.1 putative ABC transport system permease protein [Kitasatospora paracochleata]